MKKQLKTIGKALTISFNKEEQRLYGLIEGDILEISDDILNTKKNVSTIVEGIKKIKGAKK